jgi:hypothetical protein
MHLKLFKFENNLNSQSSLEGSVVTLEQVDGSSVELGHDLDRLAFTNEFDFSRIHSDFTIDNAGKNLTKVFLLNAFFPLLLFSVVA